MIPKSNYWQQTNWKERLLLIQAGFHAASACMISSKINAAWNLIIMPVICRYFFPFSFLIIVSSKLLEHPSLSNFLQPEIIIITMRYKNTSMGNSTWFYHLGNVPCFLFCTSKYLALVGTCSRYTCVRKITKLDGENSDIAMWINQNHVHVGIAFCLSKIRKGGKR